MRQIIDALEAARELIVWYEEEFSDDDAREARIKIDAALAAAREQQPVAWRDHVEQRIRTWRQSTMNKSGDRLAIDDFMGKESIDDLVDFVCDEYAAPPAPIMCSHSNRSYCAFFGIDAARGSEHVR